MKKAILAVILLLISMTSFAQKISSDNIIGIWRCTDYKIEVFRSESGYSAKLLWSKDMFEAGSKTSKKDVKNPNEKLRSRPIQGIVHISALIFKDGEYVDGKLYSVQDGNTYNLKAKLKSINDLETRGYKGIPIIGKTFNWKRIQ